MNIRVTFTEIEAKLLKQLQETGLWGLSVEDTVERLVAESLREKISPKQLVLRLRGGSTQKGISPRKRHGRRLR